MSSEITSKFSERLNFCVSCKSCKELLSMSQIAEGIRIEKGSLSKYMNEQAEPGITALFKIADYFNVTTDFLLGVPKYHSDYEIVFCAMKLTGLSFQAINKLSVMDESMKKCIGNLLEGK